MSTHLHLLLMTPAPDLGLGMKGAHERFARQMHARYAGHGHVFGARFKNKAVVTASHELACLRYIARNPVTAGLCESPEDWPWSAHGALAGLEPVPDFLDVGAVRAVITQAAYVEWANTPDARLIDQLSRGGDRAWMASAVDEHLITVADIAKRLDISRRTAYKRLRDARGTEGTVP